jgi:hypothetical protein
LVHLGVAIAVVASLGFTFVTIAFRSEPLPFPLGGRMTYEDRASFLGRATGLAGGGGAEPLPGTSVTSAETIELLESISEPLNLTLLVHAGVLLGLFGLIRNRLGALLGLAGSMIGLVSVIAIRLSLADRAADGQVVLGEGLGVAFGAGAIMVPTAFALAGGWNAVRLVRNRPSAVSRRDDSIRAERSSVSAGVEASGPLVESSGATPPLVRGVGWYLLGLLAVQIALLIGAPSDVQPGSLVWRIPLSIWQILAGAGLVTGRRWAYPATVALGAVSAIWYVVFLVIVGISLEANETFLFLPMLIMGALLLAPFALLLRSEVRAWFTASG